MDRMQSAGLKAVIDLPLCKPGGEKLRPLDNPALARGQPRDHKIRMDNVRLATLQAATLTFTTNAEVGRRGVRMGRHDPDVVW